MAGRGEFNTGKYQPKDHTSSIQSQTLDSLRSGTNAGRSNGSALASRRALNESLSGVTAAVIALSGAIGQIKIRGRWRLAQAESAGVQQPHPHVFISHHLWLPFHGQPGLESGGNGLA